MKINEARILIENGSILEQTIRPDLGTNSFFRPIKRTGRSISSFKIDGIQIHSSTGSSLVKDLKQIERKRSGLSTVITYSKK